MLKVVIIICLVALFVWYISSRDVSSLKMSDAKATVTLNKARASINGKVTEKQSLNFKTVAIEQKIFKSGDGALLVFEHAVTDDLYQFDHATPISVRMIFDAKEIILVFQANNLYFARLEMKNRDWLNIIFMQSEDQSLTLLYGLSDTAFIRVIEEIGGGMPERMEIVHDAAVTKDPEHVVTTQWNTLMHTVDSLIVPIDYE